VLAYLSQLEDGLSESERRTISETESVNATVAGQVGGGASRQVIGSVERLVTPTAPLALLVASNLHRQGVTRDLRACTLICSTLDLAEVEDQTVHSKAAPCGRDVTVNAPGAVIILITFYK
jgi:hypothetical protein